MDSPTSSVISKAERQRIEKELGTEGQKTTNPIAFLGEVFAEDVGAVGKTIKDKIVGGTEEKKGGSSVNIWTKETQRE